MLTERHVAADEHRVESWRYRCDDGCRTWAQVRTDGPLTVRNAPWTAPVVRAVLALVDQDLDHHAEMRGKARNVGDRAAEQMATGAVAALALLGDRLTGRAHG